MLYVSLLALVLLLVLFIADLVFGSVYIPIGELLAPSGVYKTILYAIRLPEAIGALLVGADLAIAGAVMQGVLKNPLADPYITGTASGAVLGSLLGIALMGFSLQLHLGAILQPAMGFAGAMLSIIIVLLLSRRGEWLRMTLAGIAVSILFSAFVMLIEAYLLSKSPGAFSLIFALFGTLSGISWNDDLIMLIVSVPVLVYVLLSYKKLNLIAMGDEITISAGVDPRGFRAVMLSSAGVLTSVALSFTGIIGFVGLVTPHLIRLLLRSADNKAVLPLSAFLGAAMLSLSNFVSKSIIPGTVVPITAITSLVGAPLLIYLLKRGGHVGRLN